MYNIEYLKFEQIDTKDLMGVLNEESLRVHLVEHPCFDENTIEEWVCDKIKIDNTQGCRVRVISINGEMAGWCGIQPDESNFEVAIVISQKFWGCGIAIFKAVLNWAREFGHQEILFHLLDSRREYKVLAKKAKKVSHTRLLGRSFTTYQFDVTNRL